jgi:hypothetical protein
MSGMDSLQNVEEKSEPLLEADCIEGIYCTEFEKGTILYSVCIIDSHRGDIERKMSNE